MLKKITPVLFLIFACSGCRLGPDYRPPVVEVAEEWKSNESASLAEPIPYTGIWWEVFDDSTLDYLEQYAIANSPNLYTALDKVAQARALAGVERAALYPQLNLYPSYSDTGTLFKLFLPPGLVIPTTTLRDIFRVHMVQYNMPLSLSYELDLWGKLTGQYESAVLDAESQAEDFYNSLLTLTSEVAISYFQLQIYAAQIGIYERTIGLLKNSLELVQTRFDKGLISYQDVLTASQQLSDTEASYFEILRLSALQKDVLATLIGVPASAFEIEVCPLEVSPPEIPTGLPADILLQRPDLMAAERHAAAQHALIGVAYASFFPSVQLTGTLGYASPDIKAFFTWQSRLWAMGANMALPIFDAGRNLSNLNWAYAHFREASHEYQQSVLTAFQEVEDALASLKYQAQEYESYTRSAETSKKRTQISTQRYVKGLTNYLDVIDSERTQLQAELNQANLLGQRYLSTVQFIKAIGGEWKPSISCEEQEGSKD